MIYPTIRAVLLAAAGAPLGLALGLLGGRLWLLGLAWLAAVMGACLADAIVGVDRRKLTLALEAPPILVLGHRGVVDVEVAFTGQTPRALELALEANGRLTVWPARMKASVDTGSVKARFELEPLRRGEARLDRLWLRWTGPLGLIFKQRQESCDLAMPIVLDIPRVKEAAARLISSSPLFGAHLQDRLGGASEFHALTDFGFGMDRRTIDWKQSARHRQLLAKTFEAERNHHVILAIDSGRQMSEPVAGIARIDRALEASLLLAFGALKTGDRVGLYAFDERPRLWSGPLAGHGAFTQLQQLAARIDYEATETNYTLGLVQLSANLQRRSLVVIFSEFTDSTTAELMVEHIARLLKTHMVLFVVIEDEELRTLERAPIDRAADVAKAVLAGALSAEREAVLMRLKRMGVEILQAEIAALGPALLARYIAIKQRALL
jgi:uncharacterized protein (DUF58 family)